MNKTHLLWWIFEFLRREHPAVLADMESRLVGDASDNWVKAALAERLAAFSDVSPAGYKFLAEYRNDDGPSTFKDLVVCDPDLRLAESEAAKHLAGATKMEISILSSDDLRQLNLQAGQIRSGDGIAVIKKPERE
jgi:hypothetical protein